MEILNNLLAIPIKAGYTWPMNCKNICVRGAMMKSIIGVNGTMELYEDHIVLKRGRLLGNFDKTTYLKDVIEVQLKKPGLTRAALVVSTALDHNGGNLTSPDANAIFLASKQWDEGVAFKRLVEDQVSRIKGSAESSPHSPADELTKFKKLFDDAVERYNVGKRKDRQIANYYEKIRQGKQEKLFHEVIFQIGNREDMAVGTSEGNQAVKVLDEYVKEFQKRNPTLRVFSCYLHQDEATPHLHIDFVPYVTNWKGKGMDTRVSLKQALKSLGFQGGNKHDTELNQWINHEKEVLAEIAMQHGIEWEQKGTHEEHLDVYNFKKKERKKEVHELEQEKENLTAENEGLTSQIADARADIKLLEEEKIQFQKDKEIAEKRAEKAETELKKLEDRREFLQPVMDNVSKEIKEYGMIKTFLPEATALERAVTYRDKKIKPLFIEMKNKIGAMAAQVKELTRERDNWKSKFQKKKQEHENTKKELAEVQKDYQKLSGEKEILQGIADRYNRLLRMLGKDMVERLVQDDIRMQAELEAKKQKEQMPKKISDRIPWAKERSEEYNAQIKKNKAKYRGMEL